jgi:hypothetical protein
MRSKATVGSEGHGKSAKDMGPTSPHWRGLVVLCPCSGLTKGHELREKEGGPMDRRTTCARLADLFIAAMAFALLIAIVVGGVRV